MCGSVDGAETVAARLCKSETVVGKQRRDDLIELRQAQGQEQSAAHVTVKAGAACGRFSLCKSHGCSVLAFEGSGLCVRSPHSPRLAAPPCATDTARARALSGHAGSSGGAGHD